MKATTFTVMVLLSVAPATAGFLMSCPAGAVCDGNSTASTSGSTASITLGGGISGGPGTANFTLQPVYLLTEGPVRPGFVSLTWGATGAFSAGAGGIASGSFGSATCSLQILETSTFCYHFTVLPVTLGQVIQVQMQLAVSNFSGHPESTGGGGGLSLEAEFFTYLGPEGIPPRVPVAVSIVGIPEPGYTWAVAAGLLLTALLRRAAATRRARL